MTTVVWTERALSDVEAIRDYIARDSETAAAHMVARFLGAVDLVAQFPRAGRVVPELGREDVRERILGNYRIVYRLLRGDAEVLTVHHAARRLEEIGDT